VSLTPPSAADRAARLAHEVRTPLHALLGTAELLRGTALDATQRAYLDTIADTAQALAALADEALREALREAPGGTRAAHDGARARRATRPPRTRRRRRARVRGARRGRRGHAAVRAAGGGARARAARDVDDAVPARVAVHAGRLRQVLVNLVANAVAYTPAGGVRVRVTHGPGAFGAVPALRVEVEDTGPGIAPSAGAPLRARRAGRRRGARRRGARRAARRGARPRDLPRAGRGVGRAHRRARGGGAG
jgi:signal transduction histidine kinase